MPGERIIPKGPPVPLAPYSPGMKSGNTVYVAGTVALNVKGSQCFRKYPTVHVNYGHDE